MIIGLRVNMDELMISFFFQAGDGIRYGTVTGVQTCALPISTQPAAEPCGYPLVACRSNLREPAPARTEGTHTSGRQGQWQRSWSCPGYTTGSSVSSTRTSVPGSPPTRRRTILEGDRSGPAASLRRTGRERRPPAG